MNPNVKPALTVMELRDRVRQSETRLRLAVQRELEQLHEAGISPDYLRVDLNDVTAFGDQVRRHAVGQVRWDVPLN